jgi:hypothetical protein
MYEIIRTFSPIFRGLNFEHPRAAAAYYVNLIINFSTNFQGILNEAQAIYGSDISRQALYAGRRELQKRGIIGRIYLTEDSDADFDREAYLRQLLTSPIGRRYATTMKDLIGLVISGSC